MSGQYLPSTSGFLITRTHRTTLLSMINLLTCKNFWTWLGQAGVICLNSKVDRL